MQIKTGQAILKCIIDLKSSVWFTLDSEDETVFCDTQNFFQLGLDSDLFIFQGYRLLRKSEKTLLETTAGTVFCELLFCTSYINTKYRLIFIRRYAVPCFQFRSLTQAGQNSSLVTSRIQILTILPRSTQTRSLRSSHHPPCFSRTKNLLSPLPSGQEHLRNFPPPRQKGTYLRGCPVQMVTTRRSIKPCIENKVSMRK